VEELVVAEDVRKRVGLPHGVDDGSERVENPARGDERGSRTAGSLDDLR
jgi:hypothetical protein